MTNTPPPDIDAQVAEFREQLTQLSAISPADAKTDSGDLLRDVLTADSDKEAGRVMLQFLAAHNGDPAYRDTVAIDMLARYGLYLALAASTFDMRAAFTRFQRVSLACRACNVTMGGGSDV